MKNLFKAALISAALCLSSAANASVLIQIDDDGNGFARFQISGTFDLTGGTASSGGAPTDFVGTNFLLDSLEITRRQSSPTSSTFASFAGTSSNDAILTADTPGFQPTGLTFDGYQLITRGNTSREDPFFPGFFIQSANEALLIAYEAPLTGAFDEDITTTLSFSLFNTGVLDFGDPDTANQGIRLEIGQATAPVPLPAGALLLLSGLGVLTLRRRARKITTT